MTTKPISNRDFAIGIILMLLAALNLSIVALFGKEITADAGLATAIFLRFFAPFLVLAWVVLVLLDQRVEFGDWRIHVYRSVLALAAQFCFFYYLSQGTLLTATLLFSTSGLFLPFVTYFSARMEIKRRTLLAVILSFLGVTISLNPAAGVSWAMLIGLSAGFLNACSHAVAHHQAKHVSTLSATLAMFGLCSVASFLVLIAGGNWPQLPRSDLENQLGFEHTLVVMLAFAVFTISNQGLRSKAFRYVNKPASLSPFYYSAIVFSGLLDWWIYGRPPGFHVYVGTGLILIGGIIMARRGKVPVQHEQAVDSVTP